MWGREKSVSLPQSYIEEEGVPRPPHPLSGEVEEVSLAASLPSVLNARQVQLDNHAAYQDLAVQTVAVYAYHITDVLCICGIGGV